MKALEYTIDSMNSRNFLWARLTVGLALAAIQGSAQSIRKISSITFSDLQSGLFPYRFYPAKTP